MLSATVNNFGTAMYLQEVLSTHSQSLLENKWKSLMFKSYVSITDALGRRVERLTLENL